MKRIVSACGIDCYKCECYIATRDNDQTGKEIVAQKWSKQYEANLTSKDIECEGCMSDGMHFAWCHKCPIRRCVIDKGYQSCADCEEYPCKTVEFLYNGVPEAKTNIENLRSR
jgi:hypothetical protein